VRTGTLVLAAVIVSAALAANVQAEVASSVKLQFVKDAPSGLGVEAAGVKLVSYRFNREIRGQGNPFTAGGGPALFMNIRNDGTLPREVALAVALYDRNGSLIGVASEGNGGKLKPGESKEIKAVIRDVNANVPYANAIQFSLQVK
jgi:hypothetical protein